MPLFKVLVSERWRRDAQLPRRNNAQGEPPEKE